MNHANTNDAVRAVLLSATPVTVATELDPMTNGAADFIYAIELSVNGEKCRSKVARGVALDHRRFSDFVSQLLGRPAIVTTNERTPLAMLSSFRWKSELRAAIAAGVSASREINEMSFVSARRLGPIRSRQREHVECSISFGSDTSVVTMLDHRVGIYEAFQFEVARQTGRNFFCASVEPHVFCFPRAMAWGRVLWKAEDAARRSPHSTS